MCVRDSLAPHLFDEELACKYKVESKLGKQVTAFSLIAFILTLVGVFSHVLFRT